jgi:hypothetical protein
MLRNRFRQELHSFALYYGCSSEVVSENEEENAPPPQKGLTSIREGERHLVVNVGQ